MSRNKKTKEKNSGKDEENGITETIDVLVLNDLDHDTSDRFESNAMIMFNHDKFLDKTTRPWSEANKVAMKHTLEKLRFQGVVHDNLKRRDLTEAVKQFALQPEISNYGCLCVAILTHGHEKSGYLRSYNRWFNEREIFKHFDVENNSALATKPIIFIIQASRGANAVTGNSDNLAGSRRGSKPDRDLEEKIDYHLPTNATRIVFHSSYTGGGNDRGSWLTQALCENISSCSSEYDFIKLFRNAWQSPKWLENSMEWTQALSFTSTITRHIYLRNKKIDEYLPSTNGDNEDIDHFTNCIPQAGLQNSESDCNIIRPEPVLMNGKSIEKEPISDAYPRTYELEKFGKNAMIIFNHEKYTHLDWNPRIGTEHDKRRLTKTFQRFRFEVTPYDDLSKNELLTKLREFGNRDFTEYGCICVAILTHGSDFGLLLAADADYREREVFACFNTHTNQTLAGKPIIFLIQACRGRMLARTAPINDLQRTPSTIELDADLRQLSGYCLPTEADMIIFHSCFFGKASVRIVDEGTWFIQTICDQLNRYASKEHLEKIFRRVRIVIALEKEFEDGKQMPVTSSTLLKKLFFVEKGRGEGME